MKKATQDTLGILQSRGYRITKARQEVLSVLAKSVSPITIQTLVQKVGVDEASVYRTITILRKETLVEELRVKGQPVSYALQHHHHDHAVCERCGFIAHVPCTLKQENSHSIPGFSVIKSHEVTWYGLCTKCA